MSLPATFVHLHLRSEFSLQDSIVRVKPLVKRAAELNMPAVAITDLNNLYCLVKFYKAARAAGIKPIFGADIWLACDEAQTDSRLTLLVKDKQGYQNLVELLSQAHLENQHLGRPVVKREWLATKSQGLVALLGRDSEVGKNLVDGNAEQAFSLINHWRSVFGDCLYLALQRSGRKGDEALVHKMVSLAAQADCAVVAVNDVCFMSMEDYEAHEARVCINQGYTLEDSSRPRNHGEQQYFKTAQEMIELFSDLPEAIENTLEIAKRCSFDISLGDNYLPDYPIPDGLTIDEYLTQVSQQGLGYRLGQLFDTTAENFPSIRQQYDERLKFELDVIIQMGFPGYFLIVADFIQWSKDNDVPVGPGRGSGAGSLVAYALKITDLDPIKYELLFERFLNPERVSMPDFDVDFCMDKRDSVIDYVKDKYGHRSVSQIITFGTMAARGVVRDVARVLGKPYGLADRMSKMIPSTPGITLKEAHEQEDVLRDFLENDGDADSAQEIWEMALKLEGITRNVGKHAGGVVIAPGNLTEFSPLYCDDEGNNLVTQYDKDDVEQVGLVKFDFLGLRTLTIIDWAVKSANSRLAEDQQVNIEKIPLDDKETFVRLKNAETTAVFQLESSGMKDLIRRLQPDEFEEIVALVALFRPGPLQSGMVDDFIDRKHGRKSVEYALPQLEPILKNTYGVILYQEQVMQIAQVLANYSLGQADMLRRAMGKKKPEEMAKQRELFNKGAAENNIDDKTATYVFDLMEKFAGYGFNKSHSAAYALVSYQTAWLKCHYPAAFMAAVLSADMDNTDKVVTLIDECNNMGMAVLPPDINCCELKFTVNDDNAVVYGLGAIKGLGEGPISAVVQARVDGPFESLFDFCHRVDLRKVNRRALEAMIRSGALDNIGPEDKSIQGPQHGRASLLASLEDAIAAAEQALNNANTGMTDLFGDVVPTGDQGAGYTLVRPLSDKQRLNGEKETLGLYLTGHPIDQYEEEIAHFISGRISTLRPGERRQTSITAGLIVAMRTMKNKRGQRMAFITLDDKSGRLEVSLFSEVYEQNRQLIIKDNLVVIEGEVSQDDYSGGLKMVARAIQGIDEARANFAKAVQLELRERILVAGFSQELKQTLLPYCAEEGGCEVQVKYERADASAQLRFGPSWYVRPEDQLIKKLREQLGNDSVKVAY